MEKTKAPNTNLIGPCAIATALAPMVIIAISTSGVIRASLGNSRA